MQRIDSNLTLPRFDADRVPPILADLWRRRLDTLISGVANGDAYYQQIANAAEHVSAEYQGRFLIELIQNANDQAVRAALADSTVTVVRTETLIAVGNSGQCPSLPLPHLPLGRGGGAHSTKPAQGHEATEARPAKPGHERK